ncbi:DUF3325 domain-containing protein [Sphingobium cloacae]|uniref:DUF3325 domain-containing protein n=1 Tax=Sphingobium cloacae TaxID=120107 RepID=A0A1E1F553_9SPHN|nr:DUF3325 domain-containing protein [Sphingobium cloacae]BAV65653.1 hypothetical protein SCLO_1026130 [Sphingobium cloacae]
MIGCLPALSALLASFAGFIALAFAMDKHHRDMTGVLPKGRSVAPWKAAGWAAIALAAVPLMLRFGTAVGITFWLGVLTLAALGAALGLTYRPRLLPLAGLVAVPLSLGTAVLSGVA